MLFKKCAGFEFKKLKEFLTKTTPTYQNILYCVGEKLNMNQLNVEYDL